jgi:drug/metabolite transporter (DMT)-like permease
MKVTRVRIRKFTAPAVPLARLTRRSLGRGLLMVVIILATSVCFVLIKAALADAPPLRFAAWRLLWGGLVLFGFLVLLRLPLVPPRATWPWLILLSLAATAFGYGAMFVSPSLAGAGSAAVLGNTQPLWVTVLAALLLGEGLTRVKVLSLLLGLVGVSLIASPAFQGGNFFGVEGALLSLASAAGFAFGSVLVRRLEPGRYLLTLTAWQLLLGSAPLFVLSAWLEPKEVVWSTTFILSLTVLAVVGTAFVTAAWNWLIQGHEVARLSLVFFLVPVFGLALAALFFGERITLLQGLGLGLVVTGLGIVSVANTQQVSPKHADPRRAGS